ncbi:MAG: flagellar basal-body rod protein FlgF [Alphaproteobacteria bacterium]|nr:flagellar basal-body rod protein FlgF [Alphaproteobacteria bacterium]
MQIPSYVALSSQAALSRQMDMVANNIANASTPAFKTERVLFRKYVGTSASGETDFVEDAASYRDTRQGPLNRTGNNLDVAIDGNGYLAVSTPEGERYTRNGHLQLGADGTLVTNSGHPVLGDDGQPLTLPAGASNVTITTDGTVSTKTGPVGKIRLVAFDDAQAEIGADGLYVSNADPAPATGATLRQGMIEESNVQPVIELTRMLNISRSYSAAVEMINGENDRIKNAIDKLSKIV